MIEVTEENENRYVPAIVDGSTHNNGADINETELRRTVRSERFRLFVVVEDSGFPVVLAMTGRSVHNGRGLKTHMPFWRSAFHDPGFDWDAVIEAIRQWFDDNDLDHVWNCSRANPRLEWLRRRAADFERIYSGLGREVRTVSTAEQVQFEGSLSRENIADARNDMSE